MRSCRSILFVPADRPDRYRKALASGADAACIDLEDAVAPERKAEGRAALREFLGDPSWDPARLMVRINDPGSPEGRLDAQALAEVRAEAGRSRPPLAAVMLPMVRNGGDVREAVRLLRNGAASVLPLVETASGLQNAVKLGEANPSVAGLVFGGFDLCLELGADPCWESLLYARSRVVHAAAATGVAAIDMPSLEVRDGGLEALREEARRVRRLGFSGKMAIHPAQLPAIHDAFGLSDLDVERAKRIVEADRDAQGGPVLLDGKMVDRPIVRAARRVLASRGDRRRET